MYWLNSICASQGVGIIHGMVSGFLDLDAGLDWIYDFANLNWLKTDTSHLHSSDCYFCCDDISHLSDGRYKPPRSTQVSPPHEKIAFSSDVMEETNTANSFVV